MEGKKTTEELAEALYSLAETLSPESESLEIFSRPLSEERTVRLKEAGVRESADGSYLFDYLTDEERDIIRLSASRLSRRQFGDHIYWFGYKFEPSATSRQRADFIAYLKGLGKRKIPADDLRSFIEFSFRGLKAAGLDTYSVDCVVSPRSGRSPLVRTMLEVFGGFMFHFTDWCSFELVKKAPNEIGFDWRQFNALYGDNPNYAQMERHVKEEILPKIRGLDYFSLAHEVKPRYCPFITNYLGFPNLAALEQFAALKGKNILVVDDINTSGATLREILRVLKQVNPSCTIAIYTLIGK